MSEQSLIDEPKTVKPVILSLPWPPSMNHYWRNFNGRAIISREGREFRKRVMAWLFGWKQPLTGRLSVRIDVNPPDNRRRDLDNLLKPMLDALQHAGVYEDDSQIDSLTITRRAVHRDGTVSVWVGQLQ
jgi:crossover junction endodeoxyribonuclease RusA